MSESPATFPAIDSDKPKIWPMYRALICVGVGCALVIVLVYEITRPIIRRNQLEFRSQAIIEVLPEATKSAAFRLTDKGSFESASADSEATNLIFAGYNDQDALVGLAIEAQGMGYADTIRVLYGYSFDSQAIIGFRVLESLETPGLGDRIETDETFLSNFDSLDVRVTSAGDKLEHVIEFVKPGEKNSDWQIDGISGATISSKAIAKMLSESSAEWIPRVRAQRDDFSFTETGESNGN
jgi:electron transport complex protein RnfG